MRRDDEANFGHLAAAVGSGLVVHDHDISEKEDAGVDGTSAAACELLGPLHRPAAKLQAVEVDAAQAQDGGASM